MTNEPLGVCEHGAKPHKKSACLRSANWRPVEASAPAAPPVTADDMLRWIVGSLKGYPNHGGDIEVMTEVGRIVKEAKAAPDAELRELRAAALLEKAADRTLQRAKRDWRQGSDIYIELQNVAVEIRALITIPQAAALQAIIQSAKAEIREAAAKVLDNGKFIHKDAPDAVWARQVAAAIRALPLGALK